MQENHMQQSYAVLWVSEWKDKGWLKSDTVLRRPDRHMVFPTNAWLFMVALCNRADHYIFALWFLSFFFFLFFPRLISAVGDWMSTILPVHTWCGFSANLECTSEMCCMRLAENTGRKKSPFWHHRTTLSGCIFAAAACIDNRKKNVKHWYLLHMCS